MCDKIFENSRKHHLITVGFLQMLQSNFNHKKAFKLATETFTNYMVEYYKLVLVDTNPSTQERFDKFRQHYEKVALKTPYLKIIESNTNILKTYYKRCPFFEVMKQHNLDNFAYAFCLSDPAFTKKVLTDVEFHRKHVISKGDRYCDNTWIFNMKN